MQREIRLRYAWIKQRRKELLEFLQANYGIEKDTTPTSKIEADLGITGDDAAELIQRFEQHFHVDMSAMDFSACFSTEAAITDRPHFLILFILSKLFLLPFALLVLPFSFADFKEMICHNHFNDWGRTKVNLTVGDLITCSFTHKFTLQKEVILKLV